MFNVGGYVDMIYGIVFELMLVEEVSHDFVQVQYIFNYKQLKLDWTGLHVINMRS